MLCSKDPPLKPASNTCSLLWRPTHALASCTLSPPPIAAKAVHTICNVLAVAYAQAGLMVQLHALLRANDFLAKHRWGKMRRSRHLSLRCRSSRF